MERPSLMAAPLSAAHGMFELLSSVQQECDEQGLGPEGFLLMACRTLAQQIGALPAAGEGEAGETGDDADAAERLRELTFCGTRFIQGWLKQNAAPRSLPEVQVQMTLAACGWDWEASGFEEGGAAVPSTVADAFARLAELIESTEGAGTTGSAAGSETGLRTTHRTFLEESAESFPASLPFEIFESARDGELQKVVKWLGKGGPVDALCSNLTSDGRTAAVSLLHAATANENLEMVRELLKRGASVDLQTGLSYTALMNAASHGHLSVLLVLLQYSANPDVQDRDGLTALMAATLGGHEACVQALLRAKANTELRTKGGYTALRWAEAEGHTAIVALIQQHAAPPQPAAASPAAAPPAAPPDAGEPVVSSPASLPLEIFESAERGELQQVVKWLGKEGSVDALCSAPTSDGPASTFGLLHAATTNDQLEMVRELLKRGASVDLPTSLGLTALMSAAYGGHLSIMLVLLQHSASIDLQSNLGHTALMKAASNGRKACVQALLRAKADTQLLDENSRTALQWADVAGHPTVADLIRQHAAPPRPATTVEAMQAEQAAQAVKADAAMEKLLAEEAAEQAKAQAPSKKSKKKKKAGRAVATGDEPSEAPPAAALALPPAAAPEPAASTAEAAGAPLRAAIAGGGMSALEVALAAAPRGVREGGVGAEAQARCDRLMKAQQEAEREAKQEAAAEAAEAARLAQAERVRVVAAREAARAAAASKARAVTAAAAHAAAEQAVAAAERAAAERAEEDRHLDEALALSMASLQADEERR
eukprot:scaffold14490_cov57-Phaeocystis_antarctica.AAC.1